MSRAPSPDDAATHRDAAVWYIGLMQSDTERLLHEALDLSVAERAKLVRALLASMDGDGQPDADAEAAWAGEIVRREERALAGHAQPVDWPAVREQAVLRLRERE